MSTATGYLWRCDVCGVTAEDAPAVLEHRTRTGHRGVSLHWLARAARRPVIGRGR